MNFFQPTETILSLISNKTVIINHCGFVQKEKQQEKKLELRIELDYTVCSFDVAEAEYLGCHPCINTSSLKMKTTDVLERFLPAVGHEYQILDIPSHA